MDRRRLLGDAEGRGFGPRDHPKQRPDLLGQASARFDRRPIYSPAPAGNVDGTYRVERYSFTSLWEDRTGTRLRQRAAKPGSNISI